MIYDNKRVKLILVLFIITIKAFSDEVDSTHYPFRVIPLPSVAPITKLAFDTAAVGQFKLRRSGERTRSSNGKKTT